MPYMRTRTYKGIIESVGDTYTRVRYNYRGKEKHKVLWSNYRHQKTNQYVKVSKDMEGHEVDFDDINMRVIAIY